MQSLGRAIELDDFLLLQFVFRANDHARIVGRVFQIVDDDPLDVRAERRHQMAHQIVRQRPFLDRAAHEHRDRAADALVDIDDENFVVVPEENRAAAARRQDRPHLHLDHRFVHPKKPYQSDL